VRVTTGILRIAKDSTYPWRVSMYEEEMGAQLDSAELHLRSVIELNHLWMNYFRQPFSRYSIS